MQLLPQAWRIGIGAAGVGLALFAAATAATAAPTPTTPADLGSYRPASPPPMSPSALAACLYGASIRARRAARHLVSFETRANADAETAASFADAASLASGVLWNLSGEPRGKDALARINEVAIAKGDEPSASVSGGVLTIVIVPSRGADGRPSGDQIERAALTF